MPATAQRNRESAGRSRPGAGKQHSVRARPNGRERLFNRDPELHAAASELPNALSRSVKRLAAATWRLPAGPWEPEDNPAVGTLDCGCLVLEGMLLSRVHVGSRWSGDLLGPGDIFCTDDSDANGDPTMVSDGGLRVLAAARIAVLDSGLMARVEVVPGIAGLLQRRLARQMHSLQVRLAIAQVPQLTVRLQLLLWELADRFGRRCADGTLIPYPLSHEVLAECCAAQRTSVLAAIHELEESGAVERKNDGNWLLHADPPIELA